MSVLIAPHYYSSFSCIAEHCKHNCCIGWEIDLDNKTYQSYKKLTGPLGEQVRKNISDEGGTPHFKLDMKDRCPFLTSNGLCKIIQCLGEDALCQICSDHPRYRNYFSSHTEIGLGLCCEEAARLILTEPNKVQLVSLNQPSKIILTEEERLLLQFRDEIIKIMQNRNLSIDKRLEATVKRCGITLEPPKKIFQILQKTERMDPTFDRFHLYLDEQQWYSFDDEPWQLPLEQLAIYFLYRHLADALEDGRVQERITFSLYSALAIATIARGRMKNDVFSMELLMDTARLYSVEVEYSDLNIEIILSNL